MNISLSLKLLVGFTVLTTVSSEALAANGDRRDSRDNRRAERRVEQAQQKAFKVQQDAVKDRQRDMNRMVKQQNRVERRVEHDIKTGNNNVRIPAPNVRRDWTPPRANNDRRFDNRWNDRDDRRWDNDDRRRYQATVNRNFRNWNDQRDYVRANIRKINQIAKLNALQQQQLDAQMRAAYLSYHNNNWNGPYNWDYYSEPQFLDYLQSYQPSLMDRILGYLGIGGVGGVGLGAGNYLYSPNWNSERDQLARNMSQIHQLALEGRITPYQEQQLLTQMQSAFLNYHNNSWNGGYGWSQYSDPGFVDYLNTSRPSILTTIRSYLGM